MQEIIHYEIRQAVRERCDRLVQLGVTGCGCLTSCCDGKREPEPKKVEESIASGCGCRPGCCSGAGGVDRGKRHVSCQKLT